jgi:NADH:ubiquinone oxidoreductase subunit F (NADH-binding)
VHRLQLAIEQAKERGLLGKDILGTGFDLDIEIYQGAGAFVCGEETALMASIEGKRGMPRPKPPFPAVKGLWMRPSVLNNVETFANVPPIILNGADWFSSLGTEKSKGTKVFALSGALNNIGLVEVPMGIPLKTIIFDIGGGIKGNRKFKAVQMGGPSGGCIPNSLIDTPVDFENINKTGAIMGSGGMVVMDETTCMPAMAKFFLEFTEDESCGKCVPCRIGNKTLLSILKRITNGEGREGDIELLLALSQQIKDTSLCGLGQTSPNPVLTTIKYFRDEYEAHIKEHRCPARVCTPLVKFVVDKDKCKMCGLCFKNCPAGAIVWEKKQVAYIDPEKCTKCKTCIKNCRFWAID